MTFLNNQYRRYGSNDDNYYMVANNGAVLYYFGFTTTYPMLGTVKSTSISFYDKGNTLGYSNPGVGGSYIPPSTTTTTPTTPTRTPRTCSLCNGRGTVGTDEGVSNYGSDKTKWCADCGCYVYLNHYHKTCPSCKGRGKW